MVYKHINDLLPQDEFGKFRPSNILKLHELEDGRILIGGNLFVNNRQISAIDEFETEAFHLWLMVVDENGCLEGEECQEVIRMDGQIKYDEPLFPIGTKWTYDFFPRRINPNARTHSFITYEVSDTSYLNDTIVYHVTNNRTLDEERFIQTENEIWFWDDGLNDWQLTYDFNAYFSYETKFGSSPNVSNTTVIIDTLGFLWFGDRGPADIQKVIIEENGTQQQPLELDILENCGNISGGLGGLRLGLDLGLFDPFYDIGEIRCFEQGDFNYNFNGLGWPTIPCDSVWTETLVNTTNFDKHQISIFPNPVSDQLFLKGLSNNVYYELYSIDGKIKEKGLSKNKRIDIDNIKSGMYFIKLLIDQNWKSFKVIKL